MRVLMQNDLSTVERKKYAWCTRRFFAPYVESVQKNVPRLAMKEVTVMLVGKRTIQELNRSFRGKDKPTDVLAFTAAPEDAKEGYAGEIAICLAQAAENARAYNRTVRKETALLFVHGFLHLVGHDHHKVAERKKMFALQDMLLGEHIGYE